jgi:hypothetical protein
MPNYKYVANSTFKPFTYDELYAPIKASEEAHDKAELAAMTLQEQVADLQGVDLGSDERNAMLNNFKRSLDDVYNQLGESGITPDLSRRLHGLKRDYARDILPIIKKVDALNLAEETRSKLTSGNPNIMFKHSLPTIGQAIDGAKIDQGYWDTGKITLSIEEQVTPLISDLLSRDNDLKSKKDYINDITAIKDKIRNSNPEFMPEGFNSDSIVDSIFNDLYYKEWLRRAQKENMQYEMNNRGKTPRPSNGGKPGSPSKAKPNGSEILEPYDAKGNPKKGWEVKNGIPVVTDKKLLNDILAYIRSNMEENARIRTPYFTLKGGTKIKNTIDFTFEGSNEAYNPKDQFAHREAWRAIRKPNTIKALRVNDGGKLEYSAKDMIDGKLVAVEFAGEEVTDVTDVNAMPVKIRKFIAEHPEAGVLRRKDGSYVVHYHE